MEASNNDVVKHLYIHQRQCLFDFGRQVNIRRARIGSAAWVVMRKNHGAGIQS